MSRVYQSNARPFFFSLWPLAADIEAVGSTSCSICGRLVSTYTTFTTFVHINRTTTHPHIHPQLQLPTLPYFTLPGKKVFLCIYVHTHIHAAEVPYIAFILLRDLCTRHVSTYFSLKDACM